MTDTRTREALPSEPAQVLIPEARKRGRVRRLATGAIALVIVGSAASAAALLVGSNGSPTHRGSSPTTEPSVIATASCSVSSLHASFDGVNSALAGSLLTGFQLENVGTSSCTVQGFPRMVFRDSSGRIVSDVILHAMGAVVHGHHATSPPPVVLRPRARAFVDVIIPTCAGYSPGILASVQLVVNGTPVPGVIRAGTQPDHPYAIGGICRRGSLDPGTLVRVSAIGRVRDFT